jgi:glycosyltransferase involved in cell wall biosynthesis
MIKNSVYKVRYYWQQNSGESAARNMLVELADGKFITFIDSDDLLMSDSVEKMMKVTESENEEVIVYGPYLRIDENGNVYGSCKRKLYSGHITKYLFQDILVHSCGAMFPKRAIEEAGGFDESLRVCSPYILLLRLSLRYRFIALAEPMFKRRRHRDNLSAISKANRLTELEVLERFYYQDGGKDVVPENLAMRRLSQEQYRVGKCLLKEKNAGEAAHYFRMAFNRYPNPKSLLMWGLSSLKQKLP